MQVTCNEIFSLSHILKSKKRGGEWESNLNHVYYMTYLCIIMWIYDDVTSLDVFLFDWGGYTIMGLAWSLNEMWIEHLAQRWA